MTGLDEFQEPPPTTPEDVFERQDQAKQLLCTYNNLEEEKKGLFSAPQMNRVDVLDGFRALKVQFRYKQNNNLDFKSWGCFKGETVEVFRNFIGTISVVMASTAVVEGDMSRHKNQRNHRDLLNDFNIQGGIHCKQWKKINETLTEMEVREISTT